jgi:hypothetical protein
MIYKNEFIEIDNKEVKQVNKLTAEKLYNSGKTIYLNGCKVRINNPYMTPMPLSNVGRRDFDVEMYEYEYFNCCNELGLYPHFFATK